MHVQVSTTKIDRRVMNNLADNIGRTIEIEYVRNGRLRKDVRTLTGVSYFNNITVWGIRTGRAGTEHRFEFKRKKSSPPTAQG